MLFLVWVKEVFLSTGEFFVRNFFLVIFRIEESRISARVLGIVVLRTTFESLVLDFCSELKCLFGSVIRRKFNSDLEVFGFIFQLKC